jgi:hypothetical protein
MRQWGGNLEQAILPAAGSSGSRLENQLRAELPGKIARPVSGDSYENSQDIRKKLSRQFNEIRVSVA